MPTWEETKYAVQTAFISAESGLSPIPENIRDAFQHILLEGHVYPATGENSLTFQIADRASK